MKLNKLVVGLFFFIWMTLNLFAGLYIPFQRYVVSIPYFIVMQVVNMGIAYEMVLLLCASFTRDGDPPKLDQMERSPRVALLYLTCNDAMPEALTRLNNQSYENHQVFVLDDSTDEAYQALVDSYGYETIRRGHRRGAKAGNLNHWLSLYGDQFEYFVVLDNGGIMQSTFTEEMLKYAEHPDNAQVAIFQSLTEAWNTSRPFSRLLDAMSPLYACLNLRVFNQCDSMLCWGHNILCRTQPFQEIGGFDEDFATEDFATNLRLIECGYQSKAVNIVSYDATSETAQFHTMRMTRWASGTLETAISKSWSLPLATKLRMFMGVHSYARWFFYILGMLLIVWGYRVTWRQLNTTLFFAFRWGRPDIVLYPLAVILFYIFYSILVRWLWITWLTRISWRDYWGHSFLSTALSFYAVSYFITAQIKSLMGKKAKYIIGEKRWFKSSLWEIVRSMKWTVLFILLVAVGITRNPVACVFNFIWYVPLFLSPLIIFWAQNTPARDNTDQLGPGLQV